MRYYRLDLSDAQTGAPVLPSSLGGLAITSLLPNGQVNPAALNVEFDIPVVNYTPGNQNKEAFFRIWGLGLKDLTSAFNLAPSTDPSKSGVNAKLSAGMSKGLPLANPSQQGLIMSGSIIQAWGNWIGTDQTVDFRFAPIGALGGAVQSGSNSFPFTWMSGTQLKDAIAQTLSTAFPNQKQVFSISQNLVLSHNEYGFYRSLPEFTNYIYGVSRALIGGAYPGVHIASDGQTVTVYDSITPPTNSTVKAIAFQDMIGQPTWIQVNTILVKLVMRGDLNVNDVISLPPSLATSTQQSFLNFQDKSAFTGNYIIQEVEHFGNFRQPDAASWNTTVTALAQPKSS